jgi:hypothetical protein
MSWSSVEPGQKVSTTEDALKTHAYRTLEAILIEAYERAEQSRDTQFVRHYALLLMEVSRESW